MNELPYPTTSFKIWAIISLIRDITLKFYTNPGKAMPMPSNQYAIQFIFIDVVWVVMYQWWWMMSRSDCDMKFRIVLSINHYEHLVTRTFKIVKVAYSNLQNSKSCLKKQSVHSPLSTKVPISLSWEWLKRWALQTEQKVHVVIWSRRRNGYVCIVLRIVYIISIHLLDRNLSVFTLHLNGKITCDIYPIHWIVFQFSDPIHTVSGIVSCNVNYLVT